MRDWTGHMSSWWWLMIPLMAAFWTVVIWAVVAVLRSGGRATTSRSDAENVLGERLARGEIDELEYRRSRALIRS
jgi:putative membrane protein